jgi:hypothetical protein
MMIRQITKDIASMDSDQQLSILFFPPLSPTTIVHFFEGRAIQKQQWLS